MSKIWEPREISTYISWVEAVLETSEELTEWEDTFIESIYIRLLKDQNLTENQANKLENIYAEKTH